MKKNVKSLGFEIELNSGMDFCFAEEKILELYNEENKEKNKEDFLYYWEDFLVRLNKEYYDNQIELCIYPVENSLEKLINIQKNSLKVFSKFSRANTAGRTNTLNWPWPWFTWTHCHLFFDSTKTAVEIARGNNFDLICDSTYVHYLNLVIEKLKEHPYWKRSQECHRMARGHHFLIAYDYNFLRGRLQNNFIEEWVDWYHYTNWRDNERYYPIIFSWENNWKIWSIEFRFLDNFLWEEEGGLDIINSTISHFEKVNNKPELIEKSIEDLQNELVELHRKLVRLMYVDSYEEAINIPEKVEEKIEEEGNANLWPSIGSTATYTQYAEWIDNLTSGINVAVADRDREGWTLNTRNPYFDSAERNTDAVKEFFATYVYSPQYDDENIAKLIGQWLSISDLWGLRAVHLRSLEECNYVLFKYRAETLAIKNNLLVRVFNSNDFINYPLVERHNRGLKINWVIYISNEDSVYYIRAITNKELWLYTSTALLNRLFPEEIERKNFADIIIKIIEKLNSREISFMDFNSTIMTTLAEDWDIGVLLDFNKIPLRIDRRYAIKEYIDNLNQTERLRFKYINF